MIKNNTIKWFLVFSLIAIVWGTFFILYAEDYSMFFTPFFTPFIGISLILVLRKWKKEIGTYWLFAIGFSVILIADITELLTYGYTEGWKFVTEDIETQTVFGLFLFIQFLVYIIFTIPFLMKES